MKTELMKTVPLGKTGISVSDMCLGTMLFGTRNSEKDSFRLLDQYVDSGRNFLDTANCYAFWEENGTGDESEKLLGRWMAERKNRDQLFIATKVGCDPNLEKGSEWPQNKEGLSSQTIRLRVEESLSRMKTDFIDLYYTHAPDNETPFEETLETLDALVTEGKVRHIGASNLPAWKLERAKKISQHHQWAEYSCLQQRHSYLRPKFGSEFASGIQEWASEELLDYCTENKEVTLLAYSPLLGGAYAREDRPLMEEYNTDETRNRLEALKSVAEEVGGTVNQVVLAWMMQGSPTIIPLIAASTPKQLEENLKAADLILSSEQLKRLTTSGS